MTEAQAKKHLKQMLRSFTPGSVLAILSEVFAESARKLRGRNGRAREQHQAVRFALYVVGLGVDAACPR